LIPFFISLFEPTKAMNLLVLLPISFTNKGFDSVFVFLTNFPSKENSDIDKFQ